MKNGFTLAELLAALAVVGVVLALAVPNYSGYAVRARRTEARVALVEAMQQQESYYTRHNAYAAYSATEPHPRSAGGPDLLPPGAHTRWWPCRARAPR